MVHNNSLMYDNSNYCLVHLSDLSNVVYLNKPAAQAAGADPSRWSSTNGQNPPFSKIAVTFEPVMQFGCPLGFKISFKIVT